MWSYWQSGEPEFSREKYGYLKTRECGLRDTTIRLYNKEPLCEIPYTVTTQAPETTGAFIDRHGKQQVGA